MNAYKPNHYNALSPYLIADDAKKLADLIVKVFDAVRLRHFEHENGKTAHMELMIDDSVIMLSDSTEHYAANQSVLHVYVPDVWKTFRQAVEHGCEIMEEPIHKPGDPDTRGSFMDFAGNFWSVSTQNPV